MTALGTCLVTGANGFTGAHLVANLMERGLRVRGLVRPTSDLSRLKEHRPTLFKGDIAQHQVLAEALTGVDTVFHTAAVVSLGLCDQAEMARVNVEGTRILLAAALKAGVKRFVHCSTIGILGDTAGTLVDETFERRQTHFSSTYDRTKFEAQTLVDAYRESAMQVVSVLPAGIFGLGDPHFGPVMARFQQGRLPFMVAADRPTGVVHVADLAECLVLAAQKGCPGARYIASAGELTTAEMFAIMAQQFSLKMPRELPEPLVRSTAWVLQFAGAIFKFKPLLDRERVHYLYDRCIRVDATRARRELGWQPMSPQETLKRSLP